MGAKPCLEKLEFCVHLANFVKYIQLHSSKSTVENQKLEEGGQGGDREGGNLLENEDNCLWM